MHVTAIETFVECRDKKSPCIKNVDVRIRRS